MMLLRCLLPLLLLLSACRPTTAPLPSHGGLPPAAATVVAGTTVAPLPPLVATVVPLTTAPRAGLLPITLPWQDGRLALTGVPAPAEVDALLAAQYGTAAVTVSELLIGVPSAPLLTITDGVLTAADYRRRFACPYFLVALDPGSSALISVIPLDNTMQPCAEAVQFNPDGSAALQQYVVPAAPTAVPAADLPVPGDVGPALETALRHLERTAGVGPFYLLAVAATDAALQILALTPDGPLHLFLVEDQAGAWRVAAQFAPPLDLERLQQAGLSPQLAFPPPAVADAALALLLDARRQFAERSVLFSYTDLPTAAVSRLVYRDAGSAVFSGVMRQDGNWVFALP
jgi:hypothetical protein